MRIRLVLLGVLCAMESAGCGSIGSHTVKADRFDYSEALSSTWKQQMLFNFSLTETEGREGAPIVTIPAG